MTAEEMDRERRRLELAALILALRIGNKAAKFARDAARLGHDPAQAAADVLLGNPMLDLPGLTPVLSDLLISADLAGRLHTLQNVDVYHGLPKPRSLAGSALDPTQAEAAAAETMYDAAAEQTVREISGAVQQAIRDATIESVTADDSIRATIGRLNGATASAGITADASHVIQTQFRTASAQAYAAGRWDSLHHPSLYGLITAFRLRTIRDDHTSKICLTPGLDGMTRPPGDPVWYRLWPPLHWNCRTVVVELYEDAPTFTEIPPVVAMPGFGSPLVSRIAA